MKSMIRLICTTTFFALFVLCASSTSLAIETVRGILRQNGIPTCSNGCDIYYLDPDSGVASINAKGSMLASSFVDKHVEITGTVITCGGCLTFNVTQITILPTTEVGNENQNVPTQILLEQNYPNPFNPGTGIHYVLPTDGYAELRVFSVLGEEVITLFSGKQHAGAHIVNWNPVDQTAGVYFYRLTFHGLNGDEFVQTKKMLYIR